MQKGHNSSLIYIARALGNEHSVFFSVFVNYYIDYFLGQASFLHHKRKAMFHKGKSTGPKFRLN